jgi:hypothetical protein
MEGAGMKPLNVAEWLEAGRIAGNDYADELLELVHGEEEARENAGALDDLRDKVPNDIAKGDDLWRLVEWISDRLDMLEEIEGLVADYGEGFTAPNGSPFDEVADKLEAMLESDRWQRYDL